MHIHLFFYGYCRFNQSAQLFSAVQLGQSDIAIGEFHRQAHVRCRGHASARCWCSCDTLTGIVDHITRYFYVTTMIRAPGESLSRGGLTVITI